MNAVILPPDLERFAHEAVAAGRYRDVADVVRAGVTLLRQMEARRADLLASVLAAEAEGDRDGYFTAEEMAERVEARLAGRRGTQA